MAERTPVHGHDVGAQGTLRAPRAVRELAARLEEAGYETWCVGGAVRDALLGAAHLDWDLATAAHPEDVRRLFRRTVPVGVEFGTVGVFGSDGRMHEVTTFRRDVRTDGRHAEVEFGASLDDDLARRDFTINAIAYSPSRDTVHDPFGGRADLAAGLVRAVGDAHQRMREDRLRALRGLRFAGRFAFRIVPETWEAIRASAGALHRLSKERVQQELVKVLEQVRRPSAALELWRASGALGELIPVLARQPSWMLHAPDGMAWPAATVNPGIAKRRTGCRLATLFVGVAAADAARTLKELRFATRDADRTARLCDAAQAARTAVRRIDAFAEDMVELRRWVSAVGRSDATDAARVAAAVIAVDPDMPTHAATTRVQAYALYRRLVTTAFRDPVGMADLALDGEDLMRELGMSPGRELGRVLHGLLDFVLSDPARNTRASLLIEAMRLRGGA